MEQNYLAQVQSLIDQKWKENPEEMKRVMADIKAKENQDEKKVKVKNPKVKPSKPGFFDPVLTNELIEELTIDYGDNVILSKVKDLVKRGADPSAKGDCSYGMTPLHHACRFNDTKFVKELLKMGINPNTEIEGGWTPLHEAVNMGNYKCAKLLLEAGANVMAKHHDGRTPLHEASAVDALKCAKLLLEAGADADDDSEWGGTPIENAGSDEMEALLEKYMK